jgi:poly-gamma-glutamate synthase PgsB/CapB
MRTLLPTLIILVLYLLWERIALDRARRRIPVRIAVTGTRGKSGVVRLLASILKEDGRRVLAKTTGSEAIVLMPDGSQIALDRSAGPSIMEQKQLIHRAVRSGADCLIAEVMSIRPENHYVESRHLLRPNIVAITNVRRDHTDLMGETEDTIASVLALDIVSRSEVFVPENGVSEIFRREARRCGASLIPVPRDSSLPWLESAPGMHKLEFMENLDLVCAIAAHLGVSRTNIVEGIRKARFDIGGLAIWHNPDRQCYFVNAFAANDPESTFRVLDKVSATIPARAGSVVGILNLRADRLPRTLQWLEILHKGTPRFRHLFVIGEFTRAIERRLPQARFLKAQAPGPVMQAIYEQITEPSILFGFGNVKGSGRALIEHWRSIGAPYEPSDSPIWNGGRKGG